MRWSSTLVILVGIALAIAQSIPLRAQPATNGQQDLRAAEADELLEDVAVGKAISGDRSHLVSEFIKIVKQGRQPRTDLAIRALGQLSSKAESAVPALCEKLADPTHGTRGFAVDALVSIGAGAVEPLRENILSPDSATRAAATVALGRMRQIELAKLDELSKDASPRVRAAVTVALAHLGPSGVAALAEMLRDSELPVAIEAARGLRDNRSVPSIALFHLTESLSRPDFGWDAAEALAEYGIEANRAIVPIIKFYPSVQDRFSMNNSIELILERIGPPDVRDIPQIVECLTLDDFEQQQLALMSLSRMGVEGRSAARALEVAVMQLIEQRHRQQSDVIPADEQLKPIAIQIQEGELASTLWAVTHDAERFTKLVERIALSTGEWVWIPSQTFWETFSSEDCPGFEALLRSPIRNAKLSALHAITHFGPAASSLKRSLLELAAGEDSELSRHAFETLTTIGARDGDKESVLMVLGKLQDNTISLQLFAEVVAALRIRSPEIESLLRQGFVDRDRKIAAECAAALCATTSSPGETAKMIIEAARANRFSHRQAVQFLMPLIPAEHSILPYLVELISSDDRETKSAAIAAIGEFGDVAASTINALKAHLRDNSAEVQWQTAKAIWRISGDMSECHRQLKAALETRSRMRSDWSVNSKLIELGSSAAPFLQHASDLLHSTEWRLWPTAIEILKSIGTDDAVSELESTAKSTDWILRSHASAALRELRDAKAKGSP